MQQIVTLLEQKITKEEKKLSLKKSDRVFVCNLESIQLLPIEIKTKKELIKALKQIKAKLLKLLEKSD